MATPDWPQLWRDAALLPLIEKAHEGMIMLGNGSSIVLTTTRLWRQEHDGSWTLLNEKVAVRDDEIPGGWCQ